MKSMVTKEDMKQKQLFPDCETPSALPLSFRLGDDVFHGLPEQWNPHLRVQSVDGQRRQYCIEAVSPEGLAVRFEVTQYQTYPAVEWIAYFENRGKEDAPALSQVQIADFVLPFTKGTLLHGNGDTGMFDGYEWFKDTLEHPISKTSQSGVSCKGAYPFMQLLGDDFGINIAIGWPAGWTAGFAQEEDGIHMTAGQTRCHTVLHAGERFMTPRITLLAFVGDETRGGNMWRRWYFDYIVPRENGQPLPPKFVLHERECDGTPEHTGASEENQLKALAAYEAGGLRPDIWWIDAGWYPCNYDWNANLGTWKPDPERFPNGLGPVGKWCEEKGIQHLLWFEPERVRTGSEIEVQHPEWILRVPDTCVEGEMVPSSICLLNLGDAACCDFMIEQVDRIIKESHVHIYRQDFNMDPLPFWETNETEDRIGALENFHVQGYLRYWDELIRRNPGLWVDCCASGGRRNDLETLRRAVPLHYTDVGLGYTPVKQKQHRQLFWWTPYFRAHNMCWENPETGAYDWFARPADKFAYHTAMAPALTDMIRFEASEEAYALARTMRKLWHKAAEIMLEADYYPLTACRKSAEDYYAMQFHNPDTDSGFFQIVRNTGVKEPAFLVQLQGLQENTDYVLTNDETGEERIISGKALREGLPFEMEPRSGVIWFYKGRIAR